MVLNTGVPAVAEPARRMMRGEPLIKAYAKQPDNTPLPRRVREDIKVVEAAQMSGQISSQEKRELIKTILKEQKEREQKRD